MADIEVSDAWVNQYSKFAESLQFEGFNASAMRVQLVNIA